MTAYVVSSLLFLCSSSAMRRSRRLHPPSYAIFVSRDFAFPPHPFPTFPHPLLASSFFPPTRKFGIGSGPRSKKLLQSSVWYKSKQRELTSSININSSVENEKWRTVIPRTDVEEASGICRNLGTGETTGGRQKTRGLGVSGFN